MKQTLTNIFSIVYLVLITYFFFYYSGSDGNLNWWGEIFPYKQFMSTVLLMLIGIVFGCLFRQIRDQGNEISILNELGKVWKSSSFWSAILVAPLVFGGVYFVGEESPSGKASLFLAFQNGFFCESIFNTIFKNGGVQPVKNNA